MSAHNDVILLEQVLDEIRRSEVFEIPNQEDKEKLLKVMVGMRNILLEQVLVTLFRLEQVLIGYSDQETKERLLRAIVEMRDGISSIKSANRPHSWKDEQDISREACRLRIAAGKLDLCFAYLSDDTLSNVG